MLKEDKELGLNTEPEAEEVEDTGAIPIRDSYKEEEAVPIEDDVTAESDAESIEAALAEFAINEIQEEPTSIPREATPEVISNDPDSEDEQEDAEAPKGVQSAEPQMTKRDKRRAREAKKKQEAEAAANNPPTEVRPPSRPFRMSR
jgi:hypothetical protein